MMLFNATPRCALILLVPLAWLLPTTSADAGELRIATSAIERIIVSQFFTTAHQRRYLAGEESSKCDYAYLESPRVAARDGRIFITVGLRARKATEILGNCVGPSDSRDVTFSAVPFFGNGALGLKEIQLEAIAGLNFPGAEGLIRSFARDSVPSTFRYEFQSDLQNGLSTAGAAQGVRLGLTEFTVRAVKSEANWVVCVFDFAFSVTSR